MSRSFPALARAGRVPPVPARAMGGFTLIELMLVVIVMAILAGIAYPSYVEQTRKSKRGQVKADLVEYAQLAERFHTTQNTYEGFTLPGGGNSVSSPREGGYGRLQCRVRRHPVHVHADRDRTGKPGQGQVWRPRHQPGQRQDQWGHALRVLVT